MSDRKQIYWMINIEKRKERNVLKAYNIRKKWQDNLEDLFNIAYVDALLQITIEEERQFLIEHRK